MTREETPSSITKSTEEFSFQLRMIGTQVRYLRGKKGWSKEKLAERAGSTPMEIEELEANPMSIDIARLVRVMEALEVQTRLSFQRTQSRRPLSIELLLDDEDDPDRRVVELSQGKEG